MHDNDSDDSSLAFELVLQDLLDDDDEDEEESTPSIHKRCRWRLAGMHFGLFSTAFLIFQAISVSMTKSKLRHHKMHT